MLANITETNVSVAFEVCFIVKRKNGKTIRKGLNKKRKISIAINKIWINEGHSFVNL